MVGNAYEIATVIYTGVRRTGGRGGGGANRGRRGGASTAGLVPRELGLDFFAGLLNQTFKTHSAGQTPIELKLIAANPIPAAHGEQFALVFRGPKGALPGQDTYWFEQERTGEFPMFIVPEAASDPGETRYVAVFNRLANFKPPTTSQTLGLSA